MNVLRAAADVVLGLILGWIAFACVARLLPRMDNPFALTLLLSGSVLSVLLYRPGAACRILSIGSRPSELTST